MTPLETPPEEIASAISHPAGDDVRPDGSFAESALPGFQLALRARRSIRVFDGEPLPEAVMRDCLRDALLAPTSSNLQPYELYWVREPEKKRRLAEACMKQQAASTAGDLVAVVARPDLWRQNLAKLIDMMTAGGEEPLRGPLEEYYCKLLPLIQRTDPLGAFNLVRRGLFWWKGRKGPMVRSPVDRGDHRVWAHVQASLVAQTLMLSLAAHGYDSCPMGGIDEKRIGRILGLPRKAEISMVISAGRRRPEGLFGSRIRFPFEDLVREVV